MRRHRRRRRLLRSNSSSSNSEEYESAADYILYYRGDVRELLESDLSLVGYDEYYYHCFGSYANEEIQLSPESYWMDGCEIFLYEMALESWDRVRMDMTGKQLYINTPDIIHILSLYTITTTNEYNSN